MLSQMVELRRLFDELTAKLAALKDIHAGDPDAIARLEAVEAHARRGSELISRFERAQGRDQAN